MVNLPPEVIKTIIKAGVVFYFPNEPFTSDQPHYFVILNHSPLEDDFLLLVNATSQVEKRKRARRNLPQTTLVYVNNVDCAFLTKDSVFDCNSATLVTTAELIEKFSSDCLKVVPEVASDELLNRLRQGVIDSPLLTRDYKELISEG